MLGIILMLQKLQKKAKLGLAVLLTACATAQAPSPPPELELPPLLKPRNTKTVALPKKPLKQEGPVMRESAKACEKMPMEEKVKYMFIKVSKPDNVDKANRAVTCVEFKKVDRYDEKQGLMVVTRMGDKECQHNHQLEVSLDMMDLSEGKKKTRTNFFDPVKRGMMLLYVSDFDQGIATYIVNEDVLAHPLDFKHYNLSHTEKGRVECEKARPRCKELKGLFEEYFTLFCKEQSSLQMRKKMASYTVEP